MNGKPNFETYRTGVALSSRTLKEGSAGDDVKWVQAKIGVGADGYFGSATKKSIIKWQKEHQLVADGLVGPGTWKALTAPPASGEPLLPAFQGGNRAATVEAIQRECARQGVTMPEQIAYVLATVQHETGNTFQPVREADSLKGKAEAYRKNNLRYYPYYGRGYVQLTWKTNYASYGKRLGVDLVTNPDLALSPDVALYILVHGMKTGYFTGKKLSNYITASRVNFRKARAIINGTDQADLIAGYAQKWLSSLKPEAVA